MTLGVAIIGAGQIALANHVRGLALVPEVKLVALADTDPKALSKGLETANLPPTAGHPDYSQVIHRDDVQAVIIATPNFTHHEIALAAIDAGRHVLCEKPLTLSLDQAGQMYHAAETKGVRHMTAFTYRFVPAMRYMHHLVRSGFIGKPCHFRANRFQDWGDRYLGWRQSSKRAGTGELGDMLSHRIDYAHLLIGPTARLVAVTRNFIPHRGNRPSDVDDYVSMLTEYDNGTTGVLESSKVCTGRGEGQNSQDYCEVNGSEGTLVYFLSTPHKLLAGRKGDAGLREIDVPPEFLLWPGSTRNPAEGDPLVTFRYDQDVEFIRAIQARRPCVPGFREGAAVQAVMETAVRSAMEQRWLDVPAVDEFVPPLPVIEGAGRPAEVPTFVAPENSA